MKQISYNNLLLRDIGPVPSLRKDNEYGEKRTQSRNRFQRYSLPHHPRG